jgi:dienelactone hydrolase
MKSEPKELCSMRGKFGQGQVVSFFIILAMVYTTLLPVNGETACLAGLGSPLTAAAEVNVNCSGFVVSGDPRSPNGATWTYQSTDLGVRYTLAGVLFIPSGTGPFPAVLISHGKGGQPNGYSANIARTMVGWGLVAIATMYTHAPDGADLEHEPDGSDGASQANVLRAHKARALLTCVGNVDLMRVAAHGHSMGAFVTGQLLGTYANDFRAASHTAGGVSEGPNATQRAAAEQIVTPYQLHHGDADTVVALFQDQTLAAILAARSADYEFHVYAGYDHSTMAFDAAMLERVRLWYQAHGIFSAAETGPFIFSASVSGKRLIVLGEGFQQGALILLNGEEQKTKNDGLNPTTILIAKKAGKRIAAGQAVTLQVKNPDRSTSPAFLFIRP